MATTKATTLAHTLASTTSSTAELNLVDGSVSGPLSPRNLIINGAMQVWQRATSHTTASGYQSVDRWQFNTYTGGAFTVSKETDSVHGDYLKWNRTSVDSSHPSAGNKIQQTIEDAQYVIGGKKVTLSFWLKDEAGLDSGEVKLRQAGSPYSDIGGGSQNWTSSGTDWEYHSFTFDVSSASTIGMSNVHLQIQMDNGTETGGVSITKVQLELGSVATPFEHRSYGEVADQCYRYYQKFEPATAQGADTKTSGGNVASFLVPFLRPMRATPSLSVTGYFQYYNGSSWQNANPTTGGANDNSAFLNLNVNSNGLGPNNSSAWHIRSNSQKIILDSEL